MDTIFIADIKCEAYWKSRSTTYIHYEDLYIGKLRIASYFYDASLPLYENKKQKVVSELPTIKNVIGWFETEKEAKEKCIEVAKVFCRQLTETYKSE